MKNKVILSVLIVTIFMFVLPMVIVNFANPYDAMGWLLILYFAINPMVSIVIGILVGNNMHKLWYVPLLVAVLFTILYWIVLHAVIFEIFVYSIIYLVMGSIAMGFTWLINKRKSN